MKCFFYNIRLLVLQQSMSPNLNETKERLKQE